MHEAPYGPNPHLAVAVQTLLTDKIIERQHYNYFKTMKETLPYRTVEKGADISSLSIVSSIMLQHASAILAIVVNHLQIHPKSLLMPISLKLFRFTKPSSRKTIIRTSLSGIPF
jgi:hypothetical protein